MTTTKKKAGVPKQRHTITRPGTLKGIPSVKRFWFEVFKVYNDTRGREPGESETIQRFSASQFHKAVELACKLYDEGEDVHLDVWAINEKGGGPFMEIDTIMFQKLHTGGLDK